MGVVNEYKEAKDIEDIVKVFTIERRVSDLFPNEINKDIKSNNSDLMIFSLRDIKLKQVINNNNFYNKTSNSFLHIFNVRGFT